MSNCSTCKTSCCTAWGASLKATAADLDKWIDADAGHVLKYLLSDGDGYQDQLWHDDDGNRLNACPFLVMADGLTSCSIYPKQGEPDMRPGICITYPGNRKCLNESLSTITIKSKASEHSLSIAVFKTKAVPANIEKEPKTAII